MSPGLETSRLSKWTRVDIDNETMDTSNEEVANITESLSNDPSLGGCPNGNSDLISSLETENIVANFLLRPTVAQYEIDALRESIEGAIDQAIRKVEDGGKDAFTNFLVQQRSDAEAFESQTVKQEEHLRALEEAAIHGNPRDYQTVLFEVAKRRNTIINLGTGKGKTLIALLTIQHFAPAFEEGKQTLFMVPSVPLCIQQSTTLQANLPYNIKVACIHVGQSESARQELAEANIIVATHGAIHDLLMHYGDMFQMERFNLVVFDECHYASGHHHYKSIMEKFYHVLPKEKRPRILGLTASPLLNVKHTHSKEQLGNMLSVLEKTLDAKVVSLRSLGVTDTNLLHKPAEEKRVFFKNNDLPADFPSHEEAGLHKTRLREFQQLNHVCHELGPLACALYCRTLMQEVSCNIFEHESSQEFRTVVSHLEAIANFCERKVASCPFGGRAEKLLKLERILEERIEFQGGEDTVGLVFVERRITAMALHNFFIHRQNQLDQGKWVRPSDMKHLNQDDQPTPTLSTLPTTNTQPNVYANESDGSGRVNSGDTSMSVHVSNPSVRSLDPSQVNGNQFEDADDQFADADEPDLDGPFVGTRDSRPLHDESMDAQDTGSVISGQFSDADEEIELADPSTAVDKVRCGVLVRQATQIFKYLHAGHKRTIEESKEVQEKSWLHQEMNIRNVLRSLRQREINLLIATSVVEEGVDVQA